MAGRSKETEGYRHRDRGVCGPPSSHRDVGGKSKEGKVSFQQAHVYLKGKKPSAETSLAPSALTQSSEGFCFMASCCRVFQISRKEVAFIRTSSYLGFYL